MDEELERFKRLKLHEYAASLGYERDARETSVHAGPQTSLLCVLRADVDFRRLLRFRRHVGLSRQYSHLPISHSIRTRGVNGFGFAVPAKSRHITSLQRLREDGC